MTFFGTLELFLILDLYQSAVPCEILKLFNRKLTVFSSFCYFFHKYIILTCCRSEGNEGFVVVAGRIHEKEKRISPPQIF